LILKPCPLPISCLYGRISGLYGSKISTGISFSMPSAMA
jgi:hypothetical protein